MLTVNVMINVMIIGQPRATAIFRWQARLAYERRKYVFGNGFTVMERTCISGTLLLCETCLWLRKSKCCYGMRYLTSIIITSLLSFWQKIPSVTPLFDLSRSLILGIHLSVRQIIFDYAHY